MPYVIPDNQPYLTAYLADRDVPCPQCAYNLRDLAGGRCPECGDALALRLGLAEPRLGTLVAGLIGLSAGTGFNGLLLVYMAIMVLRGDRGSDLWQFGTVNACGFLIEAVAVAAWLWRWPRVRRAGRARRVALVTCCWALTLVNLGVFSVTIR